MRFPEFTDEWVESRLGEIAILTKGQGLSKEQLSATGQPCILYGELYTTYKNEIIGNIYSKTEVSDIGLIKSRLNDVIIPSSGESAIDISTARCVNLDNIILGGDLNIIRLNNDSGAFLSYQLNGQKKLEIAKIAQGASVVHLYNQYLRKLKIHIPHRKEQTKIATLLSLIDQRLETQNKIIDKLESLIKGICNTVLHSFPQKKYYLSDIVTHRSVGLLSKKDIVEIGKRKCVLYGELFTIYDEVIGNIVSKTNATGFASYGNELLFPSSTTVDALSLISPSALNEKDVILGGDMFVLRVKNGFSSEFLSYLINHSYKRIFAKYAQGSTIIHLYYEHISNLDIELPSAEMQNKILLLLQKIKYKLAIEKEILSKSHTQKTFLLQKLFI